MTGNGFGVGPGGLLFDEELFLLQANRKIAQMKTHNFLIMTGINFL